MIVFKVFVKSKTHVITKEKRSMHMPSCLCHYRKRDDIYTLSVLEMPWRWLRETIYTFTYIYVYGYGVARKRRKQRSWNVDEDLGPLSRKAVQPVVELCCYIHSSLSNLIFNSSLHNKFLSLSLSLAHS